MQRIHQLVNAFLRKTGHTISQVIAKINIHRRSSQRREAFGAILWNFTGMLFSLITGVLTARLLDPDDRGLLALAITVSSVGFLISSMGTNHAVRTFQPKAPWASLRTYLRLTTLLLVLNLIIVSSVLTVFVLVGFTDFSINIIIISLLGAFTFLGSQMLDLFNAVGRVSLSAFANTIGHFITMVVLVGIYLLDATSHPLMGALCAYVTGFLVRILAMIVFIKRFKVDLGTVSADKGKSLLRNGIRFWGIGLGQTLTFRSDQLFLGFLSNAYNLGIYAVAVTPASLMQVVSNSIGQVAYREAAAGTMTVQKYKKFLSISLGITLIYGCLIWISAPWLIPFVFGSDYADSVVIVRTLLIAELLLSPYLITVRVLAGYNRPYISSASGILGFVTLAVVLSILVPVHGALGAALGSVVAYGVMLLVVGVGINKTFKRQEVPSHMGGI
ncbi:oligosaccharide flippase family protein [Yaniella flava]